jgi:hypothetical protein
MPRTLAVLTREGFTARIIEGDDKIVRFTADADIDADGANGQNGEIAAYRVDKKGSELLGNGGLGVKGGQAFFATSWGPDIAEVDEDGQPLVIDGVIITKTAYRYPGETDPRKKWVDAQTVPFIVVPPLIVRGVRGIVLGCRAFATVGRKRIEGVVADVGPRTKCGEVSIAMAEALGIPSSPRDGGTNEPIVHYEIHPGVPATVNGHTFELQPS